MKHELESRFPGEISITSDRQMTPSFQLAESEEELNSLLRKVKEENEKAGLKLNIQKTKIMAFGPITSWRIDGEKMETVRDFIFWGSKITADGDCSHEIKRRLLLGRKAMTNTRLPHPWDSPGKNTGVGCHFLLQCMTVKSESEVTQLCLTLSNPMDCSPPGSSAHGIFQARVLEWGAIAFSDEQPRQHIKKQRHYFAKKGPSMM